MNHGGMLAAQIFQEVKWSEWRDSNPRPLVPQTSALTGLRYTPTAALIGKRRSHDNAFQPQNADRIHADRARARIRSASRNSPSTARNAARSPLASAGRGGVGVAAAAAGRI